MSFVSPNSTRISKRFAELRASGELGIVAYITAGDPTIDATLKFVLALAEAGADVIELGVHLPLISRRKNQKNIAASSPLIVSIRFFLARRLPRTSGLRKSPLAPPAFCT